MLVLASTPAWAQSFVGTGMKWGDNFVGGMHVGDFDGDRKQDLLGIESSWNGFITSNTFKVQLSEGVRFATKVQWGSKAGTYVRFAVGDASGDGKDDVVMLDRGAVGDQVGGSLWVAVSNGGGFGVMNQWQAAFTLGTFNGTTDNLVFLMGDVNGDGRDDAVLFVKESRSAERGDVYVALSTGTAFGPMTRWHGFFSLGGSVAALGDVNGDGRADAISFVRDAEAEPRRGDVDVALSSGSSFGSVQKWSDLFCVGNELPHVADVDGDGRADAITFVQDTNVEPGRADVRVALSSSYNLGGWRTWHGAFSYGGELPLTGDVNGDGKTDVITALGGNVAQPGWGDVYVALSQPAPRPVETRARALIDLGLSSGTSGFYLKEVGGNVLASSNPNTVFDPASAIKATVHVHAMMEVLQGRYSLSTLVTVPQNVIGSCPDFNGPTVTKTLEESLYDMMRNSTNQDPAALRQIFGVNEVERTIDALGMASTRHLGNSGCIANEATLTDFGRLYEAVSAGLLEMSKADFIRLAWDVPPYELNRYVSNEARKYGTLPWDFLARWRNNVVSVQKAGGGGDGTGQKRTVAGLIEIPFCTSSGVVRRGFVYGAFMDKATLLPFNGASELNLNIVNAELLGEQVRASVASFGAGGCAL
jgi:hypothetical protein